MGDRVVAVRHQGELLGALAVTKPAGEPLTPAEEKLLDDVAAQAGLVLRNVRLIEDLRSSRERLVTHRRTRSGAGWSATCTTARSRAWCRWR